MSDGMDLSRSKKFFILVLLMFAGMSIYALPYLRFNYYTPLQLALGLEGKNQAYGYLSFVYGMSNLIFYLPGGWIADKYSPKKLLVFSLVSTGIIGFWFSTFPSYNTALLIHGLWGITTVLTFWSTYIKVVNVMASEDEQGEMFGLLEGGRGLIEIIFAMGLMAIFARLGSNADSLAMVIRVYSGITMISGILLAIFLPEIKGEASDEEVTIGLIFEVLKKPTTWMLGGIIFTTYVFVGGGSYLTPYLELGFGLTVAMAGTISAIRGSAMKVLSAPIYGAISKKMGRSTPILLVGFIALMILSALLLIIPANPAFLPAMIAVVLGIGFFSYGQRGVYWAIIDELKTDTYMVGTTIGVASIIGFAPDAFLYPLFGSIMDNNQGLAGYRIIFLIFLAMATIGAVITFIAERRVVEIHREEIADEENL